MSFKTVAKPHMKNRAVTTVMAKRVELPAVEL
jgi:hypothetical protein